MGIRDRNRTFQKPAFLNPGGAGHFAVAVQTENAGVNRIVFFATRQNSGNTGAHRPFADFEFSLAVNEGGVTDLDTRHVGDRVELSGHSVEGNAQIEGLSSLHELGSPHPLLRRHEVERADLVVVTPPTPVAELLAKVVMRPGCHGVSPS